MCGICIWVNRKGKVESNILEEAISLQKNRGPDQTKSVFYNNNFEEISYCDDFTK